MNELNYIFGVTEQDIIDLAAGGLRPDQLAEVKRQVESLDATFLNEQIIDIINNVRSEQITGRDILACFK